MRAYLSHIKVLYIRLFLVLFLLQITRLYFLISNFSKFSDTSFSELIWAFIVGIRFDMVSVGIGNSLFIILSILPFSFINSNNYQKTLKTIFIVINSILLFSNLLDSEYFKFTQKRSTFDIFEIVQGEDFTNMIWGYMSDYWVVFIIGILLSYFLFKFYPKDSDKIIESKETSLRLKQFLIILLIGSSTYGVIRGIDHKPITITSAAEFANAQTVSLVLNTPFTIINTFNKKALKEISTFNKTDLLKQFSPIKQYHHSEFRPLNVVLLIVESMGKEYSKLNNPNSPGYTPFLDSLSQESLRSRYSFANGKRSIEALPSLLNSFPTLMNKAFVSSPYSTNKTEGIAALLKKEGYYTSFMHGGANGTMYFDKFCYITGFDDYYGKDEYPHIKDYDGNWGIFDEPYLEYAIQKMSSFKQPFFNSVFTLSSHHPYTIPEQHKNKFPKGSSEIHESIGYVDYALKNFFSKASKEDWYNNTLFVITADHTSISESSYYQKSLGAYAVPIIFFQPKDSLLKGENLELTQHIDIMPSILDYLHYNKAFYAFGNSIFNSERKSFVINHKTARYYFTQNNQYGIYFGDSIHAFYSFPNDSILRHNLIENSELKQKYNKETDPLFRAIIQTYNNDLIKNRAFASSSYYSTENKGLKK